MEILALILEVVVWLLFGSSESKTLKSRRFRKKHGVEYDLVLGREFQGYLNRLHTVPNGWSWEIKLKSADQAEKKFRVGYDDCGGRSGIVEVSLAGKDPKYRKIEEKKIG